MPLIPSHAGGVESGSRPFNFWERLKEIDMFFAGNDAVHQTMRRVVQSLEDAGIPYAIAGGMAVNAHRYRRTTDDVDFLLNEEGLEAFRRQFVGKDFDPVPRRSKRFIDRVNGVSIDILITGRFPGNGNPGPIAYPDPSVVGELIDNARFIDLGTLVTLKLAARRHRDFGDVVELIRFNELDETFLEKLHPTLHRDYIECLEEKRREDEYQEREG